jgi:hypothetical protein
MSAFSPLAGRRWPLRFAQGKLRPDEGLVATPLTPASRTLSPLARGEGSQPRDHRVAIVARMPYFGRNVIEANGSTG